MVAGVKTMTFVKKPSPTGQKSAKFKFLKNSVTAELAFEAHGRSLNEVFTNSALAVTETMVHAAAVQQKMHKVIKLQNKELKALLIDFLNEIIYYKDAEQIFLSKFDIEIKEKENGLWLLTAKIGGEPLDYKRHQLRADVKAATYHMLELKKEKNGWLARVVLDV